MSAPPLTPTAPTSASKTTTRAGPAPITGPLEKDWKSYGGTAYFGCPQTFSAGKSSLDDIRPKIFDPKTGQYVAPAIPTIAAGENLTGAMCALTGAAADLKVVYVVTTVKPAQAPAPEISRTTAYSYDWSSGHQVATKELQPPTPGLRLAAPKEWGLAPTASGVAWVNVFTDGHAPASPPRTVVLSGADLSIMWDDPQPARVWQDVIAFPRNADPGKASGPSCAARTGRRSTGTTTRNPWTPNWPTAQTNW
ncbi:hypothetical protein I548_1824 [Mycobacterium intracellulare]|nr:hypothetical protein I548_1824 [Mycobacterium intracellulare]